MNGLICKEWIVVELKNVILEKEDKLQLFTINRPKALNALNSETLKDLDTVIDEIVKMTKFMQLF